MTSTVVITGSTRGFGLGMARAFLERDCNVVVSGRNENSVEEATSELGLHYAPDRILGQASDVRDRKAVQALWDAAVGRFDAVDIWINNAGVANQQALIWQADPMDVKAAVDTNLLGAFFGSQVAMGGMIAQGQGAIYMVEGMGSDGRKHEGLAPYGMTKYALRYLTESLVVEAKETPVLVGSVRPGMLATRLLTDQYIGRREEWERAKRIFNIIADKVEKVAPWAAKEILANGRHGATLTYLGRFGLLGRFITAPFHDRDLFPDGPFPEA